MPRPLRNVGASVRARLLNRAKERNQPFDLLLMRYVIEPKSMSSPISGGHLQP
jgi:hypothetical protein